MKVHTLARQALNNILAEFPCHKHYQVERPLFGFEAGEKNTTLAHGLGRLKGVMVRWHGLPWIPWIPSPWELRSRKPVSCFFGESLEPHARAKACFFLKFWMVL